MKNFASLAFLLLATGVAAAQPVPEPTQPSDPTSPANPPVVEEPVAPAPAPTAPVAAPTTPPPAVPAPATPATADDKAKTAPPTPAENLPKPRSDNDPAPPVAKPGMELPDGGVVEQAGVGGTVGYGRAGVLELGGSAGFMMAPGFRAMNVSPSIGWFVADNLELSGILGVSNIKAEDAEDATIFSVLVEPSYHIPFDRSKFAFLGMGVGAAYGTDVGVGLAVAPRIGMNFLVGRSGVLTPSLTFEHRTHSVEDAGTDMGRDVSVIETSSALRANIGYTAMW